MGNKCMNDFLIGMGSIMDLSGTYFDDRLLDILEAIELDWENIEKQELWGINNVNTYKEQRR
jgi:hypothetical protein